LTFQAFIDDSVTPNGEFVLAGHIATVEAWAQLSKEWAALLPSAGTLANNQRYHFKMSEMAANPERMERVPAFYWLIEKYAVMSLSCRINIQELERARKRIYVPATFVDMGFWKNPYLTCSRALLDMFHTRRSAIKHAIPEDQPVNFIFDEQMEKKVIWEAWDRYMNSRKPEIRRLYGKIPRFENDQEFLPLQSADLWAWWIRKWSESGNIKEKMTTLDFGKWSGAPSKRTLIHTSLNEDQLVEAMIEGTRTLLPPGTFIYDLKFSCGCRCE
jgi:hypothetical protein